MLFIVYVTADSADIFKNPLPHVKAGAPQEHLISPQDWTAGQTTKRQVRTSVILFCKKSKSIGPLSFFVTQKSHNQAGSATADLV